MAETIQLRSVTLTGTADGPRVLVIAGVHGDELEPMAAVRALAAHITPAELRGRVTLVPCVNEPAFGRNARTAGDGLDLARICPGEANGSISHQVARAVSAMIRDCDYLIDLHTGGVLFTLHPLAGYVLHADGRVLDTQRRMAAAMGLAVVWGTSAALDGRTLSVARDAGIPAIYAEHGGGGTFEPAAVDAYVNGCLNVLRSLGVLSGRTAPPPADQVVIEDDRDRAGFLQIQHPSPAEGFFEPACRLGQQLCFGDAIGRVVDPLGKELARVTAADSGRVVMLRAWRHVAAGDALAALASHSQGGES